MIRIVVVEKGEEINLYLTDDRFKAKKYILESIQPTEKVRIYMDDVLLPGGRNALDA